MKSRFLAQHFTVNISKFQLPRKGVKSQLSISFTMSMNMNNHLIPQRRSKSDWSLSTGSPHESEYLLQSLKSQEPPAESQYFDALDAIDEEENSVSP